MSLVARVFGSDFQWRRAKAVARKEVFHILRDPFTLATALGLPVFMVVMFGVSIEFNVKNVALAVFDADQSQSSRRLLDSFDSSRYFLVHQSHSPDQAITDVMTESARAALIIPSRFEKDLLAGRSAQAQILVDGSDSSTVAPVLGYVGAIQSMASNRIASFKPSSPYEIRTRFLFNPELNSKWFVIPGLNVIVMSMLSILLTALTVAQEWENGSMELLLSTPVQPLEIIIGKLAPYGFLGLLAVSFVFFIARVVFGVPFVGHMPVFAAGCLLFLVTYLAQGLLISVVSRNQMVAMQMSQMTGMLPSQMLSGFVFPIQSMPMAIQYFTMLFPARWFMEISRGVFLKGSSFYELRWSFFALSLSCVFMIHMGVRKFKRDLEA